MFLIDDIMVLLVEEVVCSVCYFVVNVVEEILKCTELLDCLQNNFSLNVV